MEFDIVELGNVDRRRWLSMEFDIVDWIRKRATCVLKFVWAEPRIVGRRSSTLLNSEGKRRWNVELKRTAGSSGCDTISKVFDSSATILSGIVEPGGSLRIELRDESHCVSLLCTRTNCTMYYTSKYGIVANNYDRRSGRVDDCRTGLDGVLVQTNSKWIWFAIILLIVRLRRTGLSVEVATGRTLVVGKVRLTDLDRCSRRTPQQSRPHPLYEAKAYVADERQVP